MPDGESAYYLGDFGRLRPYDLDTGTLGGPFPALGRARDSLSILAASPDGTLLAQAAWSGQGDELTTTVGVYDTSTHALQFPPVVIEGGVTGATFTSGRALLAVAMFPDARLLAFDTMTGDQVATAPGVTVPENEREVSGIAAVGDEVLVGSAYDGTVRVFDGATFELRRTITLRSKTVGFIRDVGDGTVITAGSEGLSTRRCRDRRSVVAAQRTGRCAELRCHQRTRQVLLRQPLRPARGARPRKRAGTAPARRPERQQRTAVAGAWRR